jgi:hypothetical protein
VFQKLVDPNASGSGPVGLGGADDEVGSCVGLGGGDAELVDSDVGLGDGDWVGSEVGLGSVVGLGDGERSGFEQVVLPCRHPAL